jgi:hypothetical protein
MQVALDQLVGPIGQFKDMQGAAHQAERLTEHISIHLDMPLLHLQPSPST